MNLETDFCGVKFSNPLVVASGVIGVTGASMKYAVEKGAGGVTTKSIWMKEHKGHPCPIIVANEHYMVNAVGLPHGGIESGKHEIEEYQKKQPAPLIANIVATTGEEFALTAEAVSEMNPDIIEVNISCPNVEDEFGRPFACSKDDAADVTAKVRAKTKLPIVVKLSPNVSNIVEIAKACVDAGADGLTLINSLGPGMVIDIDMREPVLANKVGGMCGPAIKPIAIKIVYEVHKALPNVPIIGTGGVTNGEDAIEMTMAGATLVGIGAGVFYRDIDIYGLVRDEMIKWGQDKGVNSLNDLRGTAVK